jgi:hypothetical protein
MSPGEFFPSFAHLDLNRAHATCCGLNLKNAFDACCGPKFLGCKARFAARS